MEYAVELEGLTKDYKTGFWRKKLVRALDGLSLKVNQGQIFGLLGPNGAGKTTTIKLLMRLIFPTAGTAKILGHDIQDTKVRQRIGYCPENPYFYDYLTAYELMLYFGELFGLTGAKCRSKAEELLNLVGLDEANWHKQLRNYSKGMLQRVGLAQSLINSPELVFLDEPMSGLDPIGRREVRELIANLRKQGVTVFMSTHILSDIEVLCDSVAILRNGKLAAVGRLDELLLSSEEENGFEVTLQQIKAEELKKLIEAEITEKPIGLTVRIRGNEVELEKLISLTRSLGGRVVSVQPIKMSLEEFFVKETKDSAVKNEARD